MVLSNPRIDLLLQVIGDNEVTSISLHDPRYCSSFLYVVCQFYESCDGSVGIATRLRAGRSWL
jgi:hypothetical protein